ncbi:SDR family NAD(P)-dependent oxidoreductase [Verticiella sediminum]|uniref:SDR family NAD(P)-dependent oxidoreductase n=1 Tax=Verticiella sediminum TaxID=1247510 RepID=UPI003CCC8638
MPLRCVITGAASGIGLALAERLLAAGWQVTGVDRQPSPVAHPAYRELVADLATPAGARSALAALDGDGTTAFVHAAGVVRSGGLGDSDLHDADAMWHLHAIAPLVLLGGLTPSMPDGRGRIVLVSSRAVLGRAKRAAYASSKAAQIGLARSLAAELVGRGITVNVVAPGATDTPMLRDPQRGEPPRVELPIGRLVRADEVAASIAFLIGEDAGAITGQTLYVCGGASLGAQT